ncbi:NAD(P)/FAD-dependent oxidoreductase, partial [Undibacterium sp. LFS511W]
ALSPLLPSNCGFERPWTPFFQEKFAGQPLLTVAARVQHSEQPMRQGQFVITASGVEGSLIYALSAALRDQVLTQGSAVLELDLLPDKSAERVLHELQSGRGARS